MNRLIGITLGLALTVSTAIASDLGLCELFEEPMGRIAGDCQEKQLRGGSSHVAEWTTLGLRPDRHGLMAEAGFGIDFDFDLQPGAIGALPIARISPTRPSLGPNGKPRAVDDGSQWLQVVVLGSGDEAWVALRHYTERPAGIELVAEVSGPTLDLGQTRQHLWLSVEREAGSVRIQVDTVDPAASGPLHLELVDFGELLPWVQLRGPLAPATGAISNSNYANPWGWSR
jgi:hypothetical protein